MTWRIDNPEDAWFRRARGPTIELWQKEGHLPGSAHLVVHVVLPSGAWYTVLVQQGTIAKKPPHYFEGQHWFYFLYLAIGSILPSS